jgi:UDP-N-acetylmuramoyl-L-alanyl-D-glutamate--2,6-diaminopimelate ligase
MQIRQLVEKAEYTLLAGSLDTEITTLVYDSRKVEQGSIFVCISGTVRDAHDFIPEVLAKGAVALVVEKDVELVDGITYIKVDNSRKALAQLSAAYFG